MAGTEPVSPQVRHLASFGHPHPYTKEILRMSIINQSCFQLNVTSRTLNKVILHFLVKEVRPSQIC